MPTTVTASRPLTGLPSYSKEPLLMLVPFPAVAYAAYERYRQVLNVGLLELFENRAVFLLASRIHRLSPQEHTVENRYAHVRLEFRDWNGRVWLKCMTRLTGFSGGNPVPVQVVGLDARFPAPLGGRARVQPN